MSSVVQDVSDDMLSAEAIKNPESFSDKYVSRGLYAFRKMRIISIVDAGKNCYTQFAECV